MNEVQKTCAKCSGEMIRGTLVNEFRLSILPVTRWLDGLPTLSAWWGLKIPAGQKTMPIATYRCQSCGFLESYAGPEFR